MVPGHYSVISTLDPVKHGKIRRVLNQGLSDAHLRKLDPAMKAVAVEFARGVGAAQNRFEPELTPSADGWSSPKNMALWCDYFTFDIMSQLIFGRPYNMLTESSDHWVLQSLHGQSRRISYIMSLPEVELLGLHKILFPGAKAGSSRFGLRGKEMMQERVARHEKEGGGVDVFSKLITSRDPETGEGLSERQLWSEANLLIVAGEIALGDFHSSPIVSCLLASRCRYVVDVNGCALLLPFTQLKGPRASCF